MITDKITGNEAIPYITVGNQCIDQIKNIYQKTIFKYGGVIISSGVHDFIYLRDGNDMIRVNDISFFTVFTNYNEFDDYYNFWKKYASEVDRIYYHNIFNWGGQLDGYKSVEKSYEPNLPCVALWSLMVFFANGDVPLCNVDYNNKYPTGNVMKNSIRELWKSKIMNARRKLHLDGNKKDISICVNCNVWDEVKGEELISPEFAEKVSILNA